MPTRQILLRALAGEKSASYANAEVDGSGNLTGGGGGVTDHGALTGLADDDHLQYHTDARGDARYAALTHTHAQSDVTGLPAALAARPPVVSGTATVTISRVGGTLEHEETVSASGVTGAMRIVPSLAATTDTDENTAELLGLMALDAVPGTDQISFRLAFGTPTSGPIKINYMAL